MGKGLDFGLKNKEERYHVSEAYAFEHYKLTDIHMISYERKYDKWRVIGDFKGCAICCLIGRYYQHAIESGWIADGVIYIVDAEIECVYAVHVFN